MSYAYPMRISGISKQTIWGGDRISLLCDKTFDKKTGELWVLSARQNDDCVILNGEFKGISLTEYCAHYLPDSIPFPILIKFIDANDRLSVQVHPDDELSSILEGVSEGKTEMWHIIDAEEGATIVYGTKENVTASELKKAVDDGNVEDILNYVPVKKGDTFFIPAGLVHAIGKGILLVEVQQSSDTTYRFYDYGRLDASGKPRQLHIEKALASSKQFTEKDIDAIRFSKLNDDKSSDIIADCDYFKVIKANVSGKYTLDMASTEYCSVVCISGKAELSYSGGVESVSAGDSFLITRETENVEFSGETSLIISIPKK